MLLLSERLPDAVVVRVSPEEPARPSLGGHPLVLGVQVANSICYAVAAVAFTRRGLRRDDELLGWFRAAAALGAWARINYLLVPSLYTEWLHTGDLLRLGMYVLLLVGSVREIQGYWAAQAAAAAEDERRRLARDLHDGVVQELGYIGSVATRARTKEGGDAAHIMAAADRAIDESQRLISALAAEPDEPLASALERSVYEVGDRFRRTPAFRCRGPCRRYGRAAGGDRTGRPGGCCERGPPRQTERCVGFALAWRGESSGRREGLLCRPGGVSGIVRLDQHEGAG